MTMTRVTERLTAGLPQTIALDAELSLAVTLPNGLAVQWRDADPHALVSSSAAEREPHAVDGNGTRRPPLRLLLLVRGAPVATLPLVAGLRRVVPDDGAAGGTTVEIEVFAWELRAGTLRSGGDFGSYVDLAWRRADSAAAAFEPPPLHPMYLRRIGAA
jgi:hypothetical protein